jgi:thiamine-phosphate pyrophosphorylase
VRGLYAIVDPERCAGRDPALVAAAILRGGCAILQLRAKKGSDREVLALARALRARTREHGVPFVVNDRPDLALLADADGVHVGQDDLPIAEVKRIAPRLEVGVSTHDLAQLRAAIGAGASLVGFGPVFATASKDRPDPVVGTDRLAAAVRAAGGVPVVAIGGIDLGAAARVRETGAPLAAAIRSLGESSDPEAAARALHRALLGETA